MSKIGSLKVGSLVKYQNYGAIYKGRVEKLLNSNMLHVLRLDGPMAGTIAWVSKASIMEVSE